MTEPTESFRYSLRGDADKARLAQQNGQLPPMHAFQAIEAERGWPPTLCGFPECFATEASNVPWHLGHHAWN